MKDNKTQVGGQLLVSAGKSSRLAAMAEKARQKQQLLDAAPQIEQSLFSAEFKPEKKQALQQANNLITKQLDSITRHYPASKRKSFFKLRYGVELDRIKNMQIKKAFSLLNIDLGSLKHYKQVEHLDLSGRPVIAEND